MADAELVCETCGRNIEVPLCCNEQMEQKDSVIVCRLCGADEEIQVCCGKKMKIIAK